MTLWIESIGFLAAFLTTASGLPQLIKTIKTKQTKDLSLLLIIASILGILFWLIYGFLIESWPVILADAVALPIWIILFIFKLKYK